MAEELELNQGTQEQANYTADNIQVLEGLEAVRKRPGMYIGKLGVAESPHVAAHVDKYLDLCLKPLVEILLCRSSVTITPSNSDYKAITTDNFSFKTEYAEVSAEFSTPILSYGDDGISAKVNSVEVYFDGISAEE